MLLDIHTHHKEGIPGENILNVEPGLFEPAEGCYYSIGIHPWKVLETEPEDWKRLEDAWRIGEIIPIFVCNFEEYLK